MKNTQAKHTIGDWQRDGEDIFISEDENNCTPICTLETDCVSVDEMEANGNLIRSAPELLDLIKRMNYAFYVDGTSKAMKPIMAETKALIARAEGNS